MTGDQFFCSVRWLPRWEGQDRMRPVLAIVTRWHWYGIRFGRERYMSFSERNQGTRGIPIIWHRWFGGFISFTRRPLPDDREYQRFDEKENSR